MREINLLLASGSPRRAFLLEQLDLSFRVMVSHVEEIVPDNMTNATAPIYLARLKGGALLDQIKPGEILLAADTVVIHNNEVLGKPENEAQAIQILSRLGGGYHSVLTGVYISDGIKHSTFGVETIVEMDKLTEQEAAYYVKKYKPYDKAGSYGIQEWIGWAKIKQIQGSYSNIMGLPTREVYAALSRF